MPIRNTWYIPERVSLTYIYDDLTVPDARVEHRAFAKHPPDRTQHR